MIIGIGIDIVHVGRMEHWHTISGLFERYFHPQELKTARSRGSSAILSLAARFAAKEAFGKALGTGMTGLHLRDIEVCNNHNGKPEISLHSSAKRAFEKSGGKSLHLTLTHEKDNAIAVVIIEGE